MTEFITSGISFLVLCSLRTIHLAGCLLEQSNVFINNHPVMLYVLLHQK